MANPLIQKLELFAPLPAADKQMLNELVRNPRRVESHVDLVREGDSPGEVRLIVEGFACRYKILPDGTRHNIAYLIPGDFCDLNVFVLKTMDHGISTLSPCAVVDVPRQRIIELTESPAIARAFWWVALVDEATLREWLVNIGGRSAEKRIAHLLCELLIRLQAVGLVTDGSYELPLTQTELGQTMGLSTVHMNRVLQNLRNENLITLNRKKVIILDVPKLKAFSGFNPNYLHLDNRDEVATTSR